VVNIFEAESDINSESDLEGEVFITLKSKTSAATLNHKTQTLNPASNTEIRVPQTPRAQPSSPEPQPLKP